MKLVGNYDDESRTLLVATGAEAAIVIVIDGFKGNGFSLSARDRGPDDNLIPKLPDILRKVADDIEAQIKSAAQS